MSTVTITPVALRAGAFAAAWTNVARAEQTETDDPFFRTMIVEVFENRGVRLIGTNGYLMLWSWISAVDDIEDDDQPDPPLDEVPDMTLWVKDRDHLIHAACKNIARQAKATSGMKVVLSVGVMEDEAQPALDPELDRVGLILAARDQRELAPLLIGFAAPEWRRALDGFDPATVDVTAYPVDALKRIGGLSNDMGYVRITHQGPDRPVLLHADCMPPVDGLMVPVKLAGGGSDTEPVSWADEAVEWINRDQGYTPSLDQMSPPEDMAEMEALADEDAAKALADWNEEKLQLLAEAADAVAQEARDAGIPGYEDDEVETEPYEDGQ